jgi:endonuclease YncB( thermonuclease family)
MTTTRSVFLGLILSVGLVAAAPAGADKTYRLTGKVIQVSDGDTLTLRTDQNHRIRLASIDAPEKSGGSKRPGQPYSEASRQFLSDRVAGKTVTLICYEKDRYDRHICDVPDEVGTVNQSLVAAGLAWANQQARGRYLRDKRLIGIEAEARAQKLGLWAEPKPIAPWVWRFECWNKGKCGP